MLTSCFNLCPKTQSFSAKEPHRTRNNSAALEEILREICYDPATTNQVTIAKAGGWSTTNTTIIYNIQKKEGSPDHYNFTPCKEGWSEGSSALEEAPIKYHANIDPYNPKTYFAKKETGGWNLYETTTTTNATAIFGKIISIQRNGGEFSYFEKPKW